MFSCTSLLPICALLALDTRQYGEDDFRQLVVPQDTTVIFTFSLSSLLLNIVGMQFSMRDVPTGMKTTPINLSARATKIPPPRAIKANTTTKPVARGNNNASNV